MDLTQFLILWGSSVITNTIIERKISYKLLKDMAKEGCKVNLERISEKNIHKGSKIIKWIPIYNLIYSMIEVNSYVNNKELILTELSIDNLITEMNDYEKMQYEKNPQLSTILQINRNELTGENVTHYVKIKSQNTEGTIYYRTTKEGKIIAIKGTEDLSSLQDTELEKLVTENKHSAIETGIVGYEDIFDELLSMFNTIPIVNKMENEEKETLSKIKKPSIDKNHENRLKVKNIKSINENIQDKESIKTYQKTRKRN